MPQFFVDQPLSENRRVDITGGDARHITQVLRLGPGDWLILSDGAGKCFRAVIESVSTSSVRVTLGEEIKRPAGSPPPTLALALAKRARFEWALQKSVELGCRHVIPFHSARTVPHAVGAQAKLARWRQIALEAAKQSGLPFRPDIDAPMEYASLLKLVPNFNPCVLFYEGESQTNLRSLFRSAERTSRIKGALLIIGPEGGFTQEEVDLALKAGALTTSLGPQILRVETAAIAALTIWQYELGNMDISS